MCLLRRTDLFDAFKMLWYYLGLPFAKLMRLKWPHPRFDTKYNALQRAAYFSVPVVGCLRSLRAGRLKNRCNSIGWPRSWEGITQRVSGISGSCGSTLPGRRRSAAVQTGVSSARHVEDRVRPLDALLQRFNGLGRWEHEQFDFAALRFALHFLHHRQFSIRSGAN